MGPCGELHICPDCKSKLVQPEHWELMENRSSWELWRRCPECGWRGHGKHHEAEIDAYDEELDRGDNELRLELESRELEDMREMAPAFSRALAEDLITAEDFVVAPRVWTRRYPSSRYSRHE